MTSTHVLPSRKIHKPNSPRHSIITTLNRSTTLTHTDTQPHHTSVAPAHSLQEAADSNNSLQGYAAMNDPTGKSEIAHYAMEHPGDEQQEIARLAYQYYEERGGAHGSHHEDWLRAENEIRSRRRSS